MGNVGAQIIKVGLCTGHSGLTSPAPDLLACMIRPFVHVQRCIKHVSESILNMC